MVAVVVAVVTTVVGIGVVIRPIAVASRAAVAALRTTLERLILLSHVAQKIFTELFGLLNHLRVRATVEYV